jgi:signal transduction histidine kinase/ligand-binding sensor domain-containing protein/ActR/RegA family two-component response regulator
VRTSLVRALVVAVAAAGLTLGARLHAQPPAPLLRDFMHEKWNTEDGLASPAMQAMVRTGDGYLWLGSARGLLRFDGLRFGLADLDAASRLHTASITALLEDDAGSLWIGTESYGLARYRAGAVEWFTGAQGLPSPHVRCLFLDRGRRLWVGTDRGLASHERQVLVPVPGPPSSIYSLAEDEAGVLWAGTLEGTTTLENGKLVRRRQGSGGVDGTIWTLARDRHNHLWAGTSGGLFESQGASQPFVQQRDFGPRWVSTLAADREGRLWIGTSGDGLHVAETQGMRRFGVNDGLSQEMVSALLVDTDGSVWVGTPDGLDRIRPRLLRTLSPEGPSRLAWSVGSDHHEGVWIGTNRGLVHAHADGFTATPLSAAIGHRVVRDSLQTRDGALWVGVDEGLVRVAPGGRPRDVPPPGHIPWGRVRALFEDRDGTLWIGATGAGLVRRDASGSLTPYPYPKDRDAGRIWTMAQDERGALWVGGHGLHRLANGRWTTYSTDTGLPTDDVMAILPDGEDLWVGAYNEGLTRLRGDRVTVFRQFNAAVAPQAYAIVDDGRGFLWVSSSYGLQRFAKRELIEVADGRRRTFSLKTFDKLDGLVSSEFNGAGEHAGARTAAGLLWFANASGAVVVDPSRMVAAPALAPVRIETVVADDRPVTGRGDVELERGRGRQRLEFQFSSPSLYAPRRVHIRYRLEGFDQDWVEAGLRRSATYTGLRGGRYHFRAQAYYADTQPVAGPEGGVTVLLPRFLSETVLFAVSLPLGLVAAGYGFNLWRVRRLRRHADELTRVVDERTQALRAAQADLERRVQERTAQLETELAERQRLETHLVQAQKLDSIGRLAGGIAHDLNNLLTAILGYASFAEHASVEDMREDVRQITAAGERAARLTQQLLAFARRQVTEPRNLNLNTVIRELEPMLRRLIGEDVELVCTLPSTPCTVRADANQIEQVLVNLVINARDAMPDGGRVTITATAAATGSEGRDDVVVTVADTGVGIPDEVKAHLFEPFFTTKPAGKGTGLGLATSYGIVTQAGGRIDIDSVVGRGTTVRVQLPRTPAAPDQPGASPREETPHTRDTRTILLSEDEPLVRAMAARVLREMGHLVFEAVDGEDALTQAAHHVGSIDLLVTDLVMPRMGGADLAARLGALRPGLNVVYMSGYADHAVAARLPSGVVMLHKPFTPATLARRVQDALNEVAAQNPAT